MATGAEHQGHTPRRNPYKKRRRVSRQFWINMATTLTVILVLLLICAFCWKGLLALWNGVSDVLGGFSAGSTDAPSTGSNIPGESTGGDPTDSTPPSDPVESTLGDREAPVLSGVHDFLIYQGDTISYMRGITAVDETDPNPIIHVDNSAVDLSKPGEYTVIYTATDAAGNVTEQTATVVILEKEEGFEDLETIYAAVDAKLAEIIRENATPKQQVNDIYVWARSKLSYGGHSDRTDWRQSAYVMLTEGRGDCYGYFAITKLMFERLGIDNIDVQKVRNYPDDSDHFWSLVSLDGGETWYHFDATPRKGSGDDFCLVTDAFLDAYSDDHSGSHNRDKSLYPATP